MERERYWALLGGLSRLCVISLEVSEERDGENLLESEKGISIDVRERAREQRYLRESEKGRDSSSVVAMRFGCDRLLVRFVHEEIVVDETSDVSGLQQNCYIIIIIINIIIIRW